MVTEEAHWTETGECSPKGTKKMRTRIGVPTEVKAQENRVGLTPAACRELVLRGHTVHVQSGAGLGSGFSDEAYLKEGAIILPDAKTLYEKSALIIKVKEPLPEEFPLIEPNHVLFTYFHFAADKLLTAAMVKSRAVCIAYETIGVDGTLPLLVPMSEVAGRMAVQEGAKYLEKAMGGRGILLGGVAGVKPAKVLILGGGIVGSQAAWVASGMGAQVTILDVDLRRMRYLGDVMPRNVRTLFNTRTTLLEELKDADLVVGAVLVPGKKAPKLVKKEDLSVMKQGAVIVDVAVDQGGCIETAKPTSHEKPTFVVDGVLHYCVANMPGAVPCTSTQALSNATIRYALAIADFGWRGAVAEFPELKGGVNVVSGYITHAGVAEAFDVPSLDVETVIMDGVPEGRPPLLSM